MKIQRENLPGGGWADLREPKDVPERLRRPVKALQMKLAKDPAFASVVAAAAGQGVEALEDIDETQAVEMATAMGDDAVEVMDQLNDRLIIARIIGWSYDQPVSMDALLDLPGEVYDRLRQLCADGALQGVDFTPSTDPDSPTGPSTASA